MPITIKKNVMAYKNPSDGTYTGIDAVNDATLEERIGAVESELDDKYEKPANGIPATDIASGVIPDVSGKTNQGAVAIPYASLTWPVTAGQYCFQNGYVYRAKQDIATSESWTAAHWDQVVLGDEVCRAMNAIQGVEEELVSTEEETVTLSMNSGEFYLPTGQHSTYSSASCSDPVAVTAKQKLKVSAKTEANLPGIVFFNSNEPSQSTFVSYACYTGSAYTYTDEEVTIPTGATYAVVQGKTSGTTALKKINTVHRIEELEDDVETLGESVSDLSDDVGDLAASVQLMENELITTEWQDVSLTMNEGNYYMPTGKPSTYSSAACSDLVPVVAGDKLKVTAKTESNLPGIVFFNDSTGSQNTFVAYACYTGSTITYTDEEVTVPTGATYATVQGKKAQTIALKKKVVTEKVSVLETEMTSVKDNMSYSETLMCNRLMALGKKSGFTWGTLPKFTMSLRVDDLRTDVDKIAKIIISEYGFPLCVAACQKEFSKSVTGITDPAEKIGSTRLEVCQWVQEHGGEILVHPDSTYTDASQIKTLFVDSLRTMADNGLKVRGTAVANTSPSAALKTSLEPVLYGFFDYADDYGSIAPYTGISTSMIGQFSSSVSDFQTYLTNRIAQNPPVWKTLVVHQLDDDVTEAALRGMLDAIQTAVNNGDMQLMLWSEVFDTYGT